MFVTQCDPTKRRMLGYRIIHFTDPCERRQLMASVAKLLRAQVNSTFYPQLHKLSNTKLVSLRLVSMSVCYFVGLRCTVSLRIVHIYLSPQSGEERSVTATGLPR